MIKVPAAPSASSEAVRRTMRGNRKRDTRPELALRSELHRLGLRFRVAIRPDPQIPFRADLVFPKTRVAVFMDGCFWHRCPQHFKLPATNSDYWEAKISRNCERDIQVSAALSAAGWVALRVWEHEVTSDAARKVATFAVNRTGATRAIRTDARNPLPLR